MRKAKTKRVSKRKPERMMVIYGFDEDMKPRAAKFSEPEFKLARKAAELMKLSVFEGEITKPRRVLRKLSPGRIFASGWSFVPNIPRNQYDKLVSLVAIAEPKPPDTLSQTSLPSSWDAIGIGHLVLGQADSAADAWWEAIVENVEGDMLVLQARDFPEAPKVTRHRLAVALLYTIDFVPPENTGSFATGLPISWATLVAGQLVLAQDAKPQNGWYEAIIIKMEGELLTLKWRDFPRQPKVKRLRTAVALVNPIPPKAS